MKQAAARVGLEADIADLQGACGLDVAQRAAEIAVMIPTGIIAAASTAPAIPRRLCRSTRCTATSALWVSSSNSQLVNTRP